MPAFGVAPVRLSFFSQGSFAPYEREIFGFIESGLVFGANATTTATTGGAVGQEPYYADYNGGPAVLLADLVPGNEGSAPAAMASDGERAIFSAAEAIWLVGAPLGGQLAPPEPVPGPGPLVLLLLGVSMLAGVWVLGRKAV